MLKFWLSRSIDDLLHNCITGVISILQQFESLVNWNKSYSKHNQDKNEIFLSQYMWLGQVMLVNKLVLNCGYEVIAQYMVPYIEMKNKFIYQILKWRTNLFTKYWKEEIYFKKKNTLL